MTDRKYYSKNTENTQDISVLTQSNAVEKLEQNY